MDDWLKAAISAGLGAAFGVAAEPLKRIATDRLSRLRQQKSIYYEIAHMYRAVALILGNSASDYGYEEAFVPILKELSFQNYKQARGRPELFYDIPHFVAIDTIYYNFEILTAHPGQNNWAVYLARARYTLNSVEQAISKNEIDIKVLLEICPANLRRRFEELAYGLLQPFWNDALAEANAPGSEGAGRVNGEPLRDWPEF